MTLDTNIFFDIPSNLKEAINLANLKKARSQMAWLITDSEGMTSSGACLLGYPTYALCKQLKQNNKAKKLYLSCQPFPWSMSYEAFYNLIKVHNVIEVHIAIPGYISNNLEMVREQSFFYYDLAEFNQASVLAVKVSIEKNRPWAVGMISADIQGGYNKPSYLHDDPTYRYLLNERIEVSQAVISDDKAFLSDLVQSKNSDEIELQLNYVNSFEDIPKILKQLKALNIFSVLIVISPISLNSLIKQGYVDELVIDCKYNKQSITSQNSWGFFEQIREWCLSAHDNLNGDTVMNYINI